MRSLNEIKELIMAGLGQIPCDLKLKNVQLVNVFSGEIYPTDIYIKNKRIVSICPNCSLESLSEIDCQGYYALPGFIDTHMHFESTMLSPEALANIIVPKGTTTICADLMEIANVAGEAGLKAMLDSIKSLPFRMLIEVSSRVPTAPDLETTGCVLGAEEVEQILDWEESISLGEIDPSKILMQKEEYLQKIQSALARRKIVNGHAIGRLGQELNVYASSGVSDDHECTSTEELLSRLRVGMKVLIREGSSERNLDDLIKGVLAEGLDFENLCFCTDDKHANDIEQEGHINYNVNRSIALGVAPIQAIKMASLNAAKHIRMEDELGSITPGRYADIILCDDLTDIQPTAVFFEGKLVAEKGLMVKRCEVRSYPDWLKDTVRLKKAVTAESFKVPVSGHNEVIINLIELIPNQIINHWKTVRMPIVDGFISADPDRDILKLAVVERYGKTGGIGLGFVKGFTLKRGALAYSMSHDHHNIVVIGENDRDMAAAVNAVVQMKGGLAAVEGNRIIAQMCLPIGGLMSEKNSDEVMEELEAMNKAAQRLGCTLPAPFMTLSFISLPTVPELGITDKGLVDVNRHKLIPLVIE